MPRRSVTRYFIPLIDVMILMFCIFLLMPAFNESEPEDPSLARKKVDAKKYDELAQLVKKLQGEIQELKKPDKGRERPTLAIRTLEVDPKDGRLFHVIPGKGGQLFEREYLKDSEAVQVLARRHRRELRQRYPEDDKRPELHYLIVTPRVDSAYPNQGQLEQYKQWFLGVANYSVDWPGGGG
jgi:hypothetical protein